MATSRQLNWAVLLAAVLQGAAACPQECQTCNGGAVCIDYCLNGTGCGTSGNHTTLGTDCFGCDQVAQNTTTEPGPTEPVPTLVPVTPVPFSSEDVKVLEDARKNVDKYCSMAAQGEPIDYEKGRATLDFNAGGDDNIVRRMLLSAEDPEEMERIVEDLNIGFVIGKGWPIALSFLISSIFWLCCWTMWPCCKCCRCFARERETGRYCLGFCSFWLFVVTGGFIASVAVTMSGFFEMDGGLVTTTCSSASLLEDLLGGDKEANFIGLLPVVSTFETLLVQLQPNSYFLSGVRDILNDTTSLDESVALTKDTVQLLEDMMAANVHPSIPSNPVDLMHKCEFCTKLLPVLTPVQDALNDGVANALSDARAEVDRQLNGPDLETFRESVSEALEPMYDFKGTIITSIGYFVTPGNFDEFLGKVQGTGSLLFFGVLYAFFVFGLMLCCSCSSVGMLGFRNKITHIDHVGNPYRKETFRCAGCAWTNACIYTFNMFLIGGIMIVVLIPLSGMCLVMEDFDRTVGNQIFTALGVNQSSQDNFAMMLDISDKCISHKSAAYHESRNTSMNLMDMVLLREPNGSRVTMRQKVVASAVDPVNDRFDEITSTLQSAPTELSGADSLVTLRRILRETPIDAMIVPEADKVLASSQYADMQLDPRTQMGFVASAACADHMPSAEFGYNATMSGVQSFYDSFETMGTPYAGSRSCADNNMALQSCTDAETTDAGKACRAANSFLKMIKNSVREYARFQCNLFADPSGGTSGCDVKDMYKDSNGVWHNTCIGEDGRVTPFQRLCSITQFRQYVQDFDLRLKNVAEMMDGSVQGTMSTVNVQLRAQVEGTFLDPVYEILDGFDCQFLKSFYRGLLDGMCYQGIDGFQGLADGYLLSALFSGILAFQMYWVWRITHDNYESWKNYDDEATNWEEEYYKEEAENPTAGAYDNRA